MGLAIRFVDDENVRNGYLKMYLPVTSQIFLMNF